MTSVQYGKFLHIQLLNISVLVSTVNLYCKRLYANRYEVQHISRAITRSYKTASISKLYGGQE